MIIRRRPLEEALSEDGAVRAVDVEVEKWQDCLVKALAEMPQELAAKILPSLPREIIIKALEGRDDPYLKLALLLLTSR